MPQLVTHTRNCLAWIDELHAHHDRTQPALARKLDDVELLRKAQALLTLVGELPVTRQPGGEPTPEQAHAWVEASFVEVTQQAQAFVGQTGMPRYDIPPLIMEGSKREIRKTLARKLKEARELWGEVCARRTVVGLGLDPGDVREGEAAWEAVRRAEAEVCRLRAQGRESAADEEEGECLHP